MECLACHTTNIDGARFCAKCGAPLPIQKSADADPMVGKTIGGRYRVTGVLGEGGMGRVYTAEQQMGTKVRKVAVKTLLSQFAKDQATVGRFMREAGNVSELHHPNTIQVYDFGKVEDSGELYIAMEFLEGRSLDDELAKGQPLQAERVERIAGQVCGSLQEAHDKGIVHRDLKPANIFLTVRGGEEVVKVLDFGIAKQSETKDTKAEQKLTQQGTILGTPPYMSPEQFGGKELDARSDIYSLGVVVYEMLTGRLPYVADTPWQWMTPHMSAQPFPFEATPLGATIPPKMKDAVMRALSKDVAHRPQTARDFFEELSTGGARMSVLGLAPGGVAAIPTHPGAGGTAMFAAGSAASRAGGTQVGEPLFPDAMPPGATAPAKTMAGEMPAPAYGAHHGGPTAGGQAYPAPPPHAAPKKGGGGGLAIVGVLAFLLIGGVAGGFFYLKGKPSDDEGPTASIPTSTGKKKDPPEEGTTSGGESATTGGGDSSASPTATTEASGAPSATPSAEPSSTPSSEPTTQPTTNPTGPGPTAPKPDAGKRPPHPGFAQCCARIPVRDKSKRQTCHAISNAVKRGDNDPNASAATIRTLGVPCP